MTQRRTNILCATERKWVLSLLAVLAAVFVLYIYFVTSSVVQVVIRQELDREATEVKAKISELEVAYMSAQHAVSSEIASHEGYVDVEEKIYIDRTPGTLVLSLQR